jgi:hypothetical protein
MSKEFSEFRFLRSEIELKKRKMRIKKSIPAVTNAKRVSLVPFIFEIECKHR